MLIKKRLTKKLYIWGNWYKVVEIIQPNKHQDFVRVERVDETRIYTDKDNNITPVVYIDIIDLHNQEIGLDNKTTHKWIKTDSIKEKEELGKQMQYDWFHLFNKDL